MLSVRLVSLLSIWVIEWCVSCHELSVDFSMSVNHSFPEIVSKLGLEQIPCYLKNYRDDSKALGCSAAKVLDKEKRLRNLLLACDDWDVGRFNTSCDSLVNDYLCNVHIIFLTIPKLGRVNAWLKYALGRCPSRDAERDPTAVRYVIRLEGPDVWPDDPSVSFISLPKDIVLLSVDYRLTNFDIAMINTINEVNFMDAQEFNLRSNKNVISLEYLSFTSEKFYKMRRLVFIGNRIRKISSNSIVIKNNVYEVTIIDKQLIDISPFGISVLAYECRTNDLEIIINPALNHLSSFPDNSSPFLLESLNKCNKPVDVTKSLIIDLRHNKIDYLILSKFKLLLEQLSSNSIIGTLIVDEIYCCWTGHFWIYQQPTFINIVKTKCQDLDGYNSQYIPNLTSWNEICSKTTTTVGTTASTTTNTTATTTTAKPTPSTTQKPISTSSSSPTGPPTSTVSKPSTVTKPTLPPSTPGPIPGDSKPSFARQIVIASVVGGIALAIILIFVCCSYVLPRHRRRARAQSRIKSRDKTSRRKHSGRSSRRERSPLKRSARSSKKQRTSSRKPVVQPEIAGIKTFKTFKSDKSGGSGQEAPRIRAKQSITPSEAVFAVPEEGPRLTKSSSLPKPKLLLGSNDTVGENHPENQRLPRLSRTPPKSPKSPRLSRSPRSPLSPRSPHSQDSHQTQHSPKRKIDNYKERRKAYFTP